MASSRQIRVVVNSLEEFINQLIKKITLDIVANLKRAAPEGGTPVDTGWARANWIPNIGSPREAPAGTRPELPNSASNSEQQAGEARVAASYRFDQGPIHITNNVPYIVYLNEGSSQQAPAGFVQRAIMKAVTEDIRR